MDVICINDQYTAEQLAIWAELGVKHPILDQLYTIREVIKHTTGQIGVLVEEIHNPKVPVKHPVLGWIEMEPTFGYHRFGNLQGVVLSYEELAQMAKERTKKTTIGNEN